MQRTHSNSKENQINFSSAFFIYTLFFFDLYNIYFSKKKMRKANSVASILFVLSLLCWMSNSTEAIYSKQRLSSYFPTQSIFGQGSDVIKMAVSVTGGQNTHRHVVLENDAADPTIGDTSYDKDDVYTFTVSDSDMVTHFVYIVSTPSFVTVTMNIYKNGKKASQYMEVVAQFDRGYRFFEVFTSTSCSIKFSGSFTTFSIVHSYDSDPFSTSLDILNSDYVTSLNSGERIKIRVEQQVSAVTKFKDVQSIQFDTYTFDSSQCLGPCAYDGIIKYLYPGTTDHCYCQGVFIKEGKTCSDCSTDTYPQCQPPAVCGNSIRQTGQACDNGNQTGCKDCKIDAGYYCSENQKNFSSCGKQKSFQRIGYFKGNPKYLFAVGDNQKYKAVFTKLGGDSSPLTNSLYIFNAYAQPNFKEVSTVTTDTIQWTSIKGTSYILSSSTDDQSISVVKISIYKNQVLFKEHFQPLSKYFTDPNGKKVYRNFYEISTTKSCKTFFAPFSNTMDSQYRLYKPGHSPTTFAQIDTAAVLKFKQSMQTRGVFFDLTIPGKWYLETLSQDPLSVISTRISIITYDHNACQNQCTPYLGKVSGLAPGTTNTCVCLDGIWNSESKKCDQPVFIVCGNGIKETGQECDNKKQAGCTDCKIAAGYFCSQDQNKLSTCAQNRCGDSKKGTNEQCDNGNTTGCIDCKVSNGYQCSQVYGQKSTCTGKCGDGIKLEGEECDNGGSPGCTNCKIDAGYKCIHNLYSKSLCQPVCGDGVRAVTEQCDNKNQTGCFNCKTVPGYKCSGAVGGISSCSISCGDGVVGGTEQCDNGNKAGCSANCVPDKGYVCKNELGASSDCSTVCGDGIRAGIEACDNGKKTGCLTCTQFDDGFTCTGAIGQRSNCKSVCGDSKRQANEQCDNGNAAGCSKNCLIDIGFSCTGAIGEKSACSATCGDSIKTSTEQCDNGKKAGCSSCTIEAGYTCKLASNMKTSICTKG